MNVRKLKQKLVMTLLGVSIFALWVVYAILTRFDFLAFITNPSVISIALILSVPLAFLLSDVLWGNKQ